MAEYFKQADEQIQSALMAQGNPGGAVLSFVYKDTLLWTGGYGSKNMNGRNNVKCILAFDDITGSTPVVLAYE